MPTGTRVNSKRVKADSSQGLTRRSERAQRQPDHSLGPLDLELPYPHTTGRLQLILFTTRVMATPSSSATSASPPMAYLQPNAIVTATSSMILDPFETEQRKHAIQKFLARAEVSMVCGLGLTVDDAS